MRHPAVCAALAFTLLPATASAQGWQGRVLIGINGAMQATSSTFEDDFTFQHPYSANIPGEEARVETRYKVPTGALFDGGAAVRLFGQFGVGVSTSLASSTSDMEIDARLPHPFYLAQHRAVEGAIAARHAERGIHIQAVYLIPATEHLYVGVSAGPSYFDVEQKVVRTVSASEGFPYDTATFASAELEALKDTGWGFNAGLDLGWMFNRNFGVGGVLRYSSATITLKPTARDTREIEAGGLHAGVGARIAF